jgi:hypothetical protein
MKRNIMTITVRHLACAALLLSCLAACKSANYCEEAPGKNCRNTEGKPDASGPACTDDSGCVGDTMGRKVCEPAAMVCVQCTAANDGACTGVTPVCGGDNACRGCTVDSECLSDVCLPDGACAAVSDVAYVDGAATDNALCTQAMPCKKIDKAMATGKGIVKLKGQLDEAVIVDSKMARWFSEPGTKLTRSNNGIILELRGTASLEIYGLEIVDASGAGTGFGVSMPAGGSATFKLTRGKIAGCREAGISSTGGTVAVTNSTVSGNTGAGISSTGGTVAVTNSTVSGNNGTGIFIDNGTAGSFKLVNNLIFRNGISKPVVGGVELKFNAAGSNVFAFNTIVDNEAKPGMTSTGGLLCDTAQFIASNNIIARNRIDGNRAAPNAQRLGICGVATTVIQNETDGLNFLQPDVDPYNYKIGAGSSAIDSGTTIVPGVTSDFEGDVRPQGTAPDQGADEYKP